MNLMQIYGERREKRATERIQVELKYKEDLLFLQNEEVEEWLEICNKIHEGEKCAYSLNQAIMRLGEQVKERDKILDEICHLKADLNDINN